MTTQNEALGCIGTELDKGNQARHLLSEILATLYMDRNQAWIHPKLKKLTKGWLLRNQKIDEPI